MPEFIIKKDPCEVARAAATLFQSIVNDAVAQRGAAFVALAGGTTPRALNELITSPDLVDSIPWSAAHFFFGDERSVEADDSESNFRMTRETLFDRAPIPEGQIYRMPADRGVGLRAGDDPRALTAAAAEYELQIQTIVKTRSGAVPRFDLIFLGMGPDGHTASLFPGSPAVDEKKRFVAPAFGGPKPMWRLTFTIPLINAARRIVMTATGEQKAAALRSLIGSRESGDAVGGQLPAGRIDPTPHGGQMTWIVDASLARAAGLPASER